MFVGRNALLREAGYGNGFEKIGGEEEGRT
jgi:hypothetical protein